MTNLPPQNSFPPSSIPSNQLPPGYSQSLKNHTGQQGAPPPTFLHGAKQSITSNSPQLGTPTQGPYNDLGLHSSNNSPAFNKPGIPPTSMPQSHNQGYQPTNILQQQNFTNQPSQIGISTSQPVRTAITNPGVNSSLNSFNQYPASSTNRGIPQQPPLMNATIPSSQPGPIIVNGPPGSVNTNLIGPPGASRANVAPPTSTFIPHTSSYTMQTSNYGPPATNYSASGSSYGPLLTSAGSFQGPTNAANATTLTSQPVISGVSTSQQFMSNTGFSVAISNPQTSTVQSGLTYGVHSASLQIPPSSQPSQKSYGPPIRPHQQVTSVTGQSVAPSASGLSLGPSSGPQLGYNHRTDEKFGPPVGQSIGVPNRTQGINQRPGGPYPPGPPSGPFTSQPLGQNGPTSAPSVGPPPIGQSLSRAAEYGISTAPQNSYNFSLPQSQAPPITSQVQTPIGPPGTQNNTLSRPSTGYQSGPTASQSIPPMGPPSFQSGPQPGPPNGKNVYPQSSMNARYPQNVHSQPNYQPNMYNGPQQMQNLTNQIGSMSVTQSGFNQMWGQQMFDLLQTRHILPEYPEEPPEIKLGHQFAESNNCSPEIFRCTLNRIPETNSLLQKSRLPLGILIHPFRDLNHLPVIQCSAIVRCRACRTYINPFVYFVDSKRWKCNLCYRVNDLPEEFQYDPVSKSYGDPTRRPEIKSATIEFIAPSEYMLRPPQPAVYLFLLDVSDIACESGYLQIFCDTLKATLDQLPGDARTQVGFICYDSNVHFYLMEEGLTRPRELTVLDIEDVFLPSPEGLLVNLHERKEMISDLLDYIPRRHSEQKPRSKSSALGSALQAAFKLMSPTGGRVTVFQTCLPNIGPGSLASREDPNARSSKDVQNLNPATDFYKRLALDCSSAQIAVDLFLISSQYSDLATLSGISKFSGGNIHYIPVFSAHRPWQAQHFKRMLSRYLTRKIGFEAVMRVRCTRGISIHAFHGNFFVRSTDLLSLPNVSPDAAFGMQLAIEESLSDLQQVCFQAALLYTSTKGERRIRVHTMCLPVASNITDVMHSADQECIIGLLVKMAVDRAQQYTLSDAREALSNVAVDTLSAHRLAQNLPSGSSSSLLAPGCLKLLCLYLSALLKHTAFRVGTSTRLDDRVAAMCDMKSLPLSQLMRSVYPSLYPVHNLPEYVPKEQDSYPDPPLMHLSAERINSNGAYLLDDGEQMIIYVCSSVSPAYLLDTFGVDTHAQLVDEARELPSLTTQGNQLLHEFIEKLNEDKPFSSSILILKDTSPARKLFTDRLLDDRLDSSMSYYEFLQHVKTLMK